MSPVSTANNPAIGYPGKYANGLGFDPIAARNPDRPKFRLDDYKEADEPRETESSRTTNDRYERDQKVEDRQANRQSDSVASKRTNSADVRQSKTEPTQTSAAAQTTADAESGAPNTATATNAEPVEKKNFTDQPADTSAPNDSSVESASGDSSSAEGTDTASNTASEITAPEVGTAPVPAQQTTPETSTKAGAAGNANEAQNAAAAPTATSRDPKLAALEKLTKTDQSASAKATSAVTGDDTTAFKLPVPWPPQAKPGTSEGNQSGTAGQTDTTAQKTAHQSQAANPAQANQAGETKPKIEIVSQEAAKPSIAADNALTANNRGPLTEGSAKQAALPSSEETIAAATALNSRAVRSNALGGSNVKRSNAVTSSNENNGAKVPATAGQSNPVVAGQASPTNPAVPAFTAVAQPQTSVTPPEQFASVRQQSSSTQRGQTDPASATSNTSRAADLPSHGTNNGFAETLKSTSVDRTTTTQDRQTLPTPATEQVKVKLVKAAHGGLDKIKIQLNPSELGKVEVRLEFGSDGGVRGTVIVDKPETMDLLQRDAKQLERALHDAGFKTGGDSLDFQMRGGGTNERQQQHAGSGNGPLSQNGGDLNGSDELPATDTTGTEHDGIGDDGSLNLVA